ncbi:MAG: hypothetical protein KDD64_16995 [Bdellovibrionales bacterium]|nr:hypothetical protein [Bdellovibrionales bacterium]
MYQAHILRQRKPTVLLHFGSSYSISKKAFLLGLSLALIQIADGLLTYHGLSKLGFEMEGNPFLRHLMLLEGGCGGVLLFTKFFALSFVVWLTFQAHSKKWIRPVLGFLTGIFFSLAVIPWCFVILH